MKKLAMLASGLGLLLMNGVVMAVDCGPQSVGCIPNGHIPEPSLLGLLGIGVVGLIALRLRNRK